MSQGLPCASFTKMMFQNESTSQALRIAEISPNARDKKHTWDCSPAPCSRPQ